MHRQSAEVLHRLPVTLFLAAARVALETMGATTKIQRRLLVPRAIF
jgi:hypothetical protein